MAKSSFDKFINKPVKGAKIKEAIRQEKKAAVRERREAIEKHYEDKRTLKAQMMAGQGTNENQSTKGKPLNAKEAAWKKKEDAKKSSKPKPSGYETSKVASEGKRESKKPYEKKPYEKKATVSRSESSSSDKKTFTPKSTGRPATSTGPRKEKEVQSSRAHKRPNENKPFNNAGPGPSSPVRKAVAPKPVAAKNDFVSELTPEELERSDYNGNQPKFVDTPRKAKAVEAKPRKTSPDKKKVDAKGGEGENAEPKGPISYDMPLNKFIAHAGVCSRRDAADLVRKGTVTVDGVTITEPAFKVTDDAVVKVDGLPLKRSRNQVYILMNKPKDFITTTDDPQERKTVMDLLKNATNERVYPVGRLDRNTSGVLLFTNDGDLAQKLSHPSYEVRKIYEVRLDKILQPGDFEKILAGVELEDGIIHADSLAYADKDRTTVGIEIHSGKNRVVRRLFEHLGYDVRGLDRVMYANLTKKNVERGKWRFLAEKEVRLLKYFNKSKEKKQ